MRAAHSLLLLSASLAACAPLREATFRVEDGAGRPARGALVRAVTLRSGPVPLPLNGATLAELLAEDKTTQTGFADAKGRVELTLVEGFPHLIEARARHGADLLGGEAPWAVYSLDAAGAALTPMDSGGDGRLTVIVGR